MTIDLNPTLDISQIPEPKELTLDGKSLVSLLRQTGSLDRRALYWHFPAYLQRYACMEGFWRTTPVGVIRKGRWKLLEFFQPKGSANRLAFDDLQNDIGDRVNLAGENTDEVRGLLRGLGQWRETVDPRFRRNRIPGMMHRPRQTDLIGCRHE